ncbi:hypothetical protein COCMIDRAFT_105504 [Bipolaris oryzae ATCC 44560]|uniref:Uncharacterized protein n=1 Tax=Bipolaris oryzae ATCC 44560 TaxID=930090 RepID=W6YVY3_COCMI|nr:uncharacterized protein COCMIDRAFT_105504 [Bipolaris oryzae ATCC 44560]EUC41683.1 hypothetical protein COCMIDRAFT_105504 [Bipolaris oryzae ATCC 44560]
MAGLDEETIDDILYLARTNEATELDSFLSELSAKAKQSKAELLTAAIDPYSKNSALHYAAANGHNDVIKLLLSTSTDKPRPEFLNAVNEAGNTPLHWAALNGHLESVKLLINSGADVTIVNRAGHDAVYEAEINDKNDVVDWLLGAVEELEKGIGQTGEGSAEESADEDMGGVNVDSAEGDKTSPQQTTVGSAVENARQQMEHLNTKDSTTKDG